MVSAAGFGLFELPMLCFLVAAVSVFRQVNRVLCNEHKQHFGWV